MSFECMALWHVAIIIIQYLPVANAGAHFHESFTNNNTNNLLMLRREHNFLYSPSPMDNSME